MRIPTLVLSTCLLLAMSSVGASAQTTGAAPNLSGNYRCEPEPDPCRMGTAISITQNGPKLELKSEKGEQADGQSTSPITLSVGGPWNMTEVEYDGAIDWSNATNRRKQ